MRPFVLPSVSSTSITISGKFYLNETSTATSGYLIYLAHTGTSGSSLRYHRSTLTDSSGGYTFNNVKPGNYQLVSESQPFASANSSTVDRRVTSDINIKVSADQVTIQPRATNVDPYAGSIVGVSLYLGNVGSNIGPYNHWTAYFDGQPDVSFSDPGTPSRTATAWAAMTFPCKFQNVANQSFYDNIYQIALSKGYLSLRQIVISDPGSGYTYRPSTGPRALANLSGANLVSITKYPSYGTSTAAIIAAGIADGSMVYAPDGEQVYVDEGDPPVPVAYSVVYSISKTPVSGYLDGVILSHDYDEFRNQERNLNYLNSCTHVRADNYTYDAPLYGRSIVYEEGHTAENSSKPSGGTGWSYAPIWYRLPYIFTGTPKPATSAVLVTRSFSKDIKPSNTTPINPANNAAQTGELSAYKKFINAVIQSINIPSLLEWGGVNDGNPLYWDIIYGSGGAKAAYENGDFGPVGSPGAIWQLDQIKGYVGRELIINAALQSAAGQLIPGLIDNEVVVNNNSTIQRYWNLPNKSLGVLGGFLANTIYQYSQAIAESSSISQLPYNIVKETASLGRQTWGTFSDVPPDWLVGKSFSGSLASGSTVEFNFTSGGYNRTVTP